MSYDPENIFAKILRGKIPCDKVYEDDTALAFRDINPQAPVHLLVIPKGSYESLDDFSNNASDAEIAGFFRAVGTVAREAGAVEAGYRFLANTGPDAHQEVAHFHVHVFAQNLGHGGHWAIWDAAGDDVAVVGQVGGDVDGEAVVGDTPANLNPDGGDLGATHPNTGDSVDRFGGYLEVGK